MKREEEIRRDGEALRPHLSRLTDPVKRPAALQGELLKNRLEDPPQGKARARRFLVPICAVAAGVIVVSGAILSLRFRGIETASGMAPAEAAPRMLMTQEDTDESAAIAGDAGVLTEGGASEAAPRAESYQEIMERILQIEGQAKENTPLLADAATPRSAAQSAPPAAGQSEGDILQSDGEYLYYLTANAQSMLSSAPGGYSSVLYIIKAGDLSLVSATEVAGTGELYLDQDRLVLVREDGAFPNEDQSGGEEYLYEPVSHAQVYDVADPKEPELLRTFSQEGSLISSKLQDGVLYLVSEWSPTVDAQEEPQNLSPRIYDSASGAAGRLEPRQVLLPPQAQSASFAVVSALGVGGSAAAQSQAVLGGAQELYLGKQNLYIANVRYEGETEYTDLLRFSLDGGALTCAAAGAVEGLPGWDAPMDEYGGYLRLAVTARGEARVYLLDGALQECARVEGFAKDAQLGGVVYRGERAYLSVLGEEEALWVLDLGDPQNAAARGKMALSGDSQRLYAVDENTLLGLGLNTYTGKDGGLYSGGLRLALYDVSNPDYPREAGMSVLGERASSEALYDSKALLLEDGLLGLPAELRGAEMSGDGQMRDSGYFLYEIRDGQLSELLRTTHQKDAAESDYSSVHILRGVVSGDTLYTASGGRVAATGLKTKERRQLLELS